MNYIVCRATTKEQFLQAKTFVNTYHSYISWSNRPSRKCYWLLYEDGIFAGVFGLGSAFVRPKVISNFMQKYNIQFNEVGNNIVYCLNGCKDKNAGTRFLKLIRKDAVIWWKEKYNDTLKVMQTFILPPRTGSMYKADNWIQLGETTGGKSQVTKTIQKKDLDKFPEAKETIFKNGEIRYLVRNFVTTEKKLIFVRFV